MTPREEQEFIRLYNSGMKIKDIATRFGIKSAYACVIRDKLGLPRRVGRPVRTIDIPREEFTELWNAGVTIQRISKRFGIAGKRVYDLSIYYDLPERPKNKPDHSYIKPARPENYEEQPLKGEESLFCDTDFLEKFFGKELDRKECN